MKDEPMFYADGTAVPRCEDCKAPTRYCLCVAQETVRNCMRLAEESGGEAYRYRRIWQAAASCLQHNKAEIKPRGPDEKRMLEAADAADLGTLWSGTTDGWI